MSADKPKCYRCGAVAETYDFDIDTTFWGWVVRDIETVVTRRLRIVAHYFRRQETRNLSVDEKQPLCGDCWSAFVGRFLQGRSVDALPGKEGR